MIRFRRKPKEKMTPRRAERKAKALSMKVDYSGTELTDEEKTKLNGTLACYSRPEHTRYLKVHLKKYNEEGKRSKYVVNLEAVTDFGKFSAQNVAWVMTKSVRKCLRKVERQVNKAMKRRK